MASYTADYLIIGNSAAGVTAAEYIRATDTQGSILILSDETHAAYGRPLISYLIEGKTTVDQMGFKNADFYETHAIETLFGPEYKAVKLDAEKHVVELENGDVVTYSSCLIATGSVPFVPPIKGIDGKENVHSFITLDQANDLWAEALEVTEAASNEGRKSRALVVGAGLIGLKAAEALAYHVDEVIVLELAPRILPAVLDDEGGVILDGMLADRGITCMPGVSVEEFYGEDGRITSALLTNGETLECGVVVAAVGVRPNSSLAVDAGAQQGRGLVCGTDLQTSLPDVYAAGDVTQVTDLLDGAQRPLALWPNAMRQGKTAGLFMAKSPQAEPFEGNFAVNAVDFFDISLLTAGVINPAPEMECEVTVIAEGDMYTKFVTKDDRLMGYILLNRPANAGIYTALIERRIPLSTLDNVSFEKEPLNLDFPEAARWCRLHMGYPSSLDHRGWKE